MYTNYLQPKFSHYPRGLRNNNPGNLVITAIKWDGKIPTSQNTDGHFEQFTELRYGIRAMMRDLYNDVQKGQNNIVKLISAFAPAFENQTPAYINTVATLVGLNPTAAIDLTEETLIALCKAIVLVENGSDWAYKVSKQDYRDALAIFGKPLKKKLTR